jgi:hypothetical protein
VKVVLLQDTVLLDPSYSSPAITNVIPSIHVLVAVILKVGNETVSLRAIDHSATTTPSVQAAASTLGVLTLVSLILDPLN